MTTLRERAFAVLIGRQLEHTRIAKGNLNE